MLRAALAMLVGLSLVIAAPSSAQASAGANAGVAAPTAAGTPVTRGGGRSARLKVVVRTPRGVPASIRLRGPKKAVVTKSATGARLSTRVSLRAGRYRVEVDDVVVGGVSYRAVDPPRRVRVSRSQPSRTLRVRMAKVKTVRLATRAVGPDAVRLSWKAPQRSSVVLRRATGERAPAGPGQGRAVRVKRGRAIDRKVSPGRVYSYAVFVKNGRTGWRRGAVTVGVPSTDGTSPPFSLTPGSIVVDGADKDTVSTAGGVVTVALARGRRTPPLGSGVVLPVSPLLPGGYVGTVAEVSPDGRVVTLAAGGLADVFASLDLRQTISSDPITLTPVTRTGEAAARVASYNAEKAARAVGGGRSARAAAAPSKSCLTLSVGHQLADLRPILRPSGHWNSGVKEKWGIPYAATFDLQVALETGFRMDLETSVAFACALPLDKVVKQLTVYPVPITMVFEPTVEVSVSGAVELHDVEATLTNGFWARGQIGLGAAFASGPINTGRVGAPSVIGRSVALTAKLGGALTVGPGVGSKEVGVVAGVSGYVNPFVAELKVVGASSPTQPAGCVSFQTRLEAGIALEAKAWAGRFSWSASWKPDALTFHHNWRDPWYYPERCAEDPETGTGDVQATLTWNSTADLDLYVTDPYGEEIYYRNRTSESGGELDVDANAGCEEVMVRPTENIYWPAGESPAGTYAVQVVQFDDCGDPDLSWHLVVRVGGVVVLDRSGRGTSTRYSFTRPG